MKSHFTLKSLFLIVPFVGLSACTHGAPPVGAYVFQFWTGEADVSYASWQKDAYDASCAGLALAALAIGVHVSLLRSPIYQSLV
jgi:hypothetical protein